MNRDGGAACTYERFRSASNALPKPVRSPPREVLTALPDSIRSLPPDLCERPSTPLALLKWNPLPDDIVAKEAPGAIVYPPSPIASPFTVLPSIHFQTVPRLLLVPFSVIDPERVPVSWVSGDDLDMSVYVIFLLISDIFVGPKGLKTRFLVAA